MSTDTPAVIIGIQTWHVPADVGRLSLALIFNGHTPVSLSKLSRDEQARFAAVNGLSPKQFGKALRWMSVLYTRRAEQVKRCLDEVRPHFEVRDEA